MKFKVGDAVLFPNLYGEIYSKEYDYKYGSVMAGFITEIEYLEARNSYLYTVGTISPLSDIAVIYRVVGEHRLFNINDYAGCIEEVRKLAQKVEE